MFNDASKKGGNKVASDPWRKKRRRRRRAAQFSSAIDVDEIFVMGDPPVAVPVAMASSTNGVSPHQQRQQNRGSGDSKGVSKIHISVVLVSSYIVQYIVLPIPTCRLADSHKVESIAILRYVR